MNRVVHIIPGISEESSGPTYSVTNLCEALIKSKLNLQLFALDFAPIEHPPYFLKTFSLSSILPRRFCHSSTMLSCLRQECRKGQISIIHNHGMWTTNSFYPMWAARRQAVVVIQSVRGAFSEYALSNGSKLKPVFWRLLQYPALKRVSCFHATSEKEYNDIRRLGFEQPVAIISNGIDVPPKKVVEKSNVRTLLFLGRIHPVKGLDVLLTAWGAVQDDFQNWRLKIVGDDKGYFGTSGYLDDCKSLAKTLCLERVEFSTPVFGENKFNEFRNADLFVLPSYSENFAMTVAESLATGTPVIVSKGAPWPTLNEHSAGWWIEMGAPPLIDCLKKALNKSRAELFEMGRQGREWMHKDFAWCDIAAQMTSVYKWLIDKNVASLPPCVKLD